MQCFNSPPPFLVSCFRCKRWQYACFSYFILSALFTCRVWVCLAPTAPWHCQQKLRKGISLDEMVKISSLWVSVFFTEYFLQAAFLSFVFCHLEVDYWITLCDRGCDGSCLSRNIKFFNSFYSWISNIFCGFILSYFVYLWRAFLLTSMCILGKNGSIPRMQKKIKTKKRMVPHPFNRGRRWRGSSSL